MINQMGYQLGVVGMSDIDNKQFYALDEGIGSNAVSAHTAAQENIGDMDLSKTTDKDVTKKSFHNFKRVLKKSPARSLASAGVVTVVLCGAAFYSLGSGSVEEKAGRDMQALDTIEFDSNATGRDQLTQAQVDHIQAKGEMAAQAASTGSNSYAANFSDVLVTSVDGETMSDGLDATQVSFDDGASKGANFADSNTVRNTQISTSINYGQASAPATGNYGATAGAAAMPAPAIQRQALEPMQQGAGDPNATYQTDGSGGGAGGGGGDGGMGFNAPNPTGIDPSIEALRQSLEDDYTRQQSYDQQYNTTAEQAQTQQNQYIQQETQQRQQNAAQAIQQQQQGFFQPNSGTAFTAATYIPKQSNSNNAANTVWNNNMSAVANGAAQGQGQAQPVTPEDDIAKDLPRHVVRVGTTWQVVVENEVNTDNGTTVFARALSGPYSGARLIGTMRAVGLGDRSAGVVFETLIPVRGNKNALPIKAVGMTLGDLNTHIATSVNRHYLQRYSALIAQGVTGGYGEAYSDTNGRSYEKVNNDGSVTITTIRDKPDSSVIRGQVLGQLGTELQAEFQQIRGRPTTYTVSQGTPLTIMFVENLDTKKAATNSINVGQTTYSNTSSYGMQPRNINK